jgi:hypothetical protein
MNNHHAIMDDVDAAEADFARRQHQEYIQCRDNLGGDSEFSELLEEMAKEFPHIKPHDAQEILDFMRDKGAFKSSRKISAASGFEVISKFKEICQDIWSEEPSLKNYARFYALNIPFLDDLYGGMTQTEFARHLCGKRVGDRDIVSITKAAVGKECKEASARLRKLGIKLVPRPEQRSEESCARMKQAREKQLGNDPSSATGTRDVGQTKTL